MLRTTDKGVSGTLKKAYLLLADGTLFEGSHVGAEGAKIAEIVFNTGMAGYQEAARQEAIRMRDDIVSAIR